MIVNILSVFSNLRLCGYGHAVITDNTVTLHATQLCNARFLGAARDLKCDL